MLMQRMKGQLTEKETRQLTEKAANTHRDKMFMCVYIVLSSFLKLAFRTFTQNLLRTNYNASV